MYKEVLEDEILSMWESHRDFSNIFGVVCECPEEEFDQEATANMLMGALELMNFRMTSLYRLFDEMESDGYIE